jgi:peptidoglycan/LPS O-acetylase OafA/YrhL
VAHSAQSPGAGRKPKRIDALTGVRFLAAALVLLFHYGATYIANAGAPPFVGNFLHHGYLGVSLFFILSGFILTYNYQDRVQKKWLAPFFFARFARIYPVYVLALLIALPVLEKPLLLGDAFRVLTLTQSWAPAMSEQGYAWVMQAWTLSVEFFFYLIFPFVLPLILALDLSLIALLTVVCWAAMIVFGIPTLAPGIAQAPTIGDLAAAPLPILRSIEFLLGMLVCRLITLHELKLNRFAGNVLTFAVMLSIVAIMAGSNDPRLLGLAMALTSVLLVLLAEEGSVIAWFLSTRVMIVLGAASYAMYIVQGPVRAWMHVISDDTLGRFASPFVTVGVSVLIYFVWEKPARTWLLAAFNRSRRTVASTASSASGAVVADLPPSQLMAGTGASAPSVKRGPTP